MGNTASLTSFRKSPESAALLGEEVDKKIPVYLWLSLPSTINAAILFPAFHLVALVALPEQASFFSAIYGASNLFGWIYVLFFVPFLLHFLRGCVLALVCAASTLSRGWLLKYARNDLLIALALYVLFGCAASLAWSCASITFERPPGATSTAKLASHLSLPKSMKLGAAWAAYQHEGNLTHSNWYRFENTPRAGGRARIRAPSHAGMAADMWHRFDQDLDIAHKQLKLETLRFSMSWSRIQPLARGSFDEGALSEYERWLKAMTALKIEPMVTLLHYEEPQWVTDQGSWLNSTTIGDFLALVKVLATRFGRYVDTWATLNEPVQMVTIGYLEGRWPPGMVGRLREAWTVYAHLMQAHVRTYALLHEFDTHDADGDGVRAAVGIAHNMNYYEPATNWNVVDPLSAGAGSLVLKSLFLAGIDATNNLDWLGINHYYRMSVSLGPGEGQTSPASLGQQVCEAHQLLPTKTISITEHGFDDASRHDASRAEYIVSSLYCLQQTAEREGIILNAYQHWDLLDGFEWEDCFEPRYGLIEVNLTGDLSRTPRDFAKLYAQIAARAVPVF